MANSPYTNWQAASWNKLRRVWEELLPVAPGLEPCFGGELIDPANAGLVFQTWILHALRLSGANVEGPVRVPMASSETTKEEIDGIVYHFWQGFLVESKLIASRMDFGPIARLHLLVERRPAGTLGLYLRRPATQPRLSSPLKNLGQFESCYLRRPILKLPLNSVT
jgi:hypothetical protein